MGVGLNKNFVEISEVTSKPGAILERYEKDFLHSYWIG